MCTIIHCSHIGFLGCLLHPANKTGLHYDMDLFCVNSLHMEDNQAPHGTCVNQSVKHQTYAALQNAHETTRARMHRPAFTDVQQREVKVNQEADRDGSTQTSAPSQRQMVSQSGRLLPPPLSASHATPSSLPLDLRLGTHGRWHLANVTPLFPAKINYAFITLALRVSWPEI